MLGDLTGAARDLAVINFTTKLGAKISVPIGLLSGIIAGLLINGAWGLGTAALARMMERWRATSRNSNA